jgi:tRNA-guanine family transglycosylase
VKPIITWAITTKKSFDNDLAKVSGQEGLMLGGNINVFQKEVNRHIIKVYCQDSGGFQLYNQNFNLLNDFSNEKKWMDKKLYQYEMNKVDWGVVFDHPLKEPKDPRRKNAESFEQALNGTIRNTKYMEERKTGRYKLFHVLKGFDPYHKHRNKKLLEWKKRLIEEVGEGEGYAVSYSFYERIAVLDILLDLYIAIVDLERKPLHILGHAGIYATIMLTLISERWKNMVTADSANPFRLSMRAHVLKERENRYAIICWMGESCDCPACSFHKEKYGEKLEYDNEKKRYMLNSETYLRLSYHNIFLYQRRHDMVWHALTVGDWEELSRLVGNSSEFWETKINSLRDQLDNI